MKLDVRSQNEAGRIPPAGKSGADASVAATFIGYASTPGYANDRIVAERDSGEQVTCDVFAYGDVAGERIDLSSGHALPRLVAGAELRITKRGASWYVTTPDYFMKVCP